MTSATPILWFSVLAAAVALPFAGCSTRGGGASPADADAMAARRPLLDAATDGLPPAGTFCSLPGSVVSTAQGITIVPGATGATFDLTWLGLPVGFCAHYFATVRAARQLRFAPGGDLLVASPTAVTIGGAANGVGGIVLLQDGDHDGVADANITFLSGVPAVQGLLFANGYLYYQDGKTIRRVPFNPGDRQPSGPSEVATTIGAPQAAEHWPKVLDVAQDGTIYVTNASSENEVCTSARPTFGAIFTLNADGSTTEVSKGFRNPIAMRCEKNHNVCLAAELVRDYSADSGGREKIVPVRQGDDWGYPCCATRNVPYTGATYQDTGQAPDCSGVGSESASFVVSHTPFGIDFEPGLWPAPWTGRAFVTLHGEASTWKGARLVGIALDPDTGLPLPATELDGGPGNANGLLQLATGWDDGHMDHGRPAPVAFAPDGRLFLGDDQQGAVIWIAPVALPQR